jgi:hypothetical protein
MTMIERPESTRRSTMHSKRSELEGCGPVVGYEDALEDRREETPAAAYGPDHAGAAVVGLHACFAEGFEQCAIASTSRGRAVEAATRRQ